MIRSVFSKGMETLLIETLISARRAGLLNEVWDEIRETPPDRMERTLQMWIRSHARLGIGTAFESEPQNFTDVIDLLAQRVSE